MGCDAEGPVYDMFSEEFLLTHPVWDVTQEWRILKVYVKFLLTHPVWDVTTNWANNSTDGLISTHTSRVGCDLSKNLLYSFDKEFLLTHPVWDVTTLKISPPFVV